MPQSRLRIDENLWEVSGVVVCFYIFKQLLVSQYNWNKKCWMLINEDWIVQCPSSWRALKNVTFICLGVTSICAQCSHLALSLLMCLRDHIVINIMLHTHCTISLVLDFVLLKYLFSCSACWKLNIWKGIFTKDQCFQKKVLFSNKIYSSLSW